MAFPSPGLNMMTTTEDPPSQWEELGLHERTMDQVGVVIALICILLLIFLFYHLDRRWTKKMRDMQAASGLMKESSAYALNLVRHFMPSWKLEKYQFRGLQAKETRVSIAFEDLNLEIPSGALVLQGVTGAFTGGRMCAIMGPSGAGKTTFMNVLCGKATYGQMAGTIRINGKEADISSIKSVLGFVPQDDIVHQSLTVREQITFSAKLRNQVGMSPKRVELITDDVINVMQIDHIQNNIVGGVEQRGISGGQRKRVNIGLELAAQPTVLFLDEPTSGLDSTSSLAVCLSLKKMCQLGMTSIMVIHQPRYSLFTLFDDVHLLGKGGQTVYLGPSLGAKPYFESHGFVMPANENPADWFMDMICGEVASTTISDFKPQMFFELWEQKASASQLQSGGEEDEESQPRCRNFDKHDDMQVLQGVLEEEWNKCDIDKDGFMSEEELGELLRSCSEIMPSEVVVRELFLRMAGTDQSRVTKQEFVDYLMSLRGDVADDRLMSSPRGPQLKMVQAKDSDEESSDTDSELSDQDADYSALQRTIPGFGEQLVTLIYRRAIQWWRLNKQRGLFLGAIIFCAVFIAGIDVSTSAPQWDAGTYLKTHTCVALLVSIFCLGVFGHQQPLFWRESASGIHIFAYYLSRVLVNAVDYIIYTFCFTAVYFEIRQPHVKFGNYFVPYLLTAYVAASWGYFMSTIVPPANGAFVCLLVVYIVCGLLGSPLALNSLLEGGVAEWVTSSISITRWSVAMSFQYQIYWQEPSSQDPRLFMEKEVYERGMILGEWWTPFAFLISQAIVLNFLAFLCLRFRNRDKQV
mmetsp:Transcript_38160/g.81116  ORF Transcript_38160/g.81116 Transcript_38160/m.81116 type:complete len:806 (+) Transcript_38160:62-2479(+)